MMHITIYCDLCGRDCSKHYIELVPIRHIQGERFKYANRHLEICENCFHSVFNRNMDIEFVEDYDDFGDGF